MVAAAVIGGSVIGAGASMAGGSMAAGAQRDTSREAIEAQMRMYNQTRSDLAPYRDAGVDSTNALMSLMGLQEGQTPLDSYLLSPIAMDQAALEQTPGYQFALTQGLKSVQNSAAARGLGVSGAAMKGAANFATGLADQTYQTQFNMENINRQNAYNRLMGLTQVGQNAAAQTGSFGTQTAGQIGQNLVGMGNAQAANYMNMANNVGNVGQTVGNMYMSNAMLQNMGYPGFLKD